MRNLIGPTALIAGLMLGSAALAASQQAAPVVQREDIGTTTIGAPIEQVTVSQPVSYADLNLANPADVKVLDQRIQSTAKKDCAELRQVDPALGNPIISGGHCVRSADHVAEQSARAAIAGANNLR